MLIKKLLPSIIAIALLISVVAITGNNDKKTDKTVNAIAEVKEEKEIRGIWVTYMDLDMRGTDMTYKSFIKKFKYIAETSKEKGFNTLIVQVRPFCDALYKSHYFPYSHILTGKQGNNPGYDPLKYMCHYAHKIGLDIHAWINPYRIKYNDSPQKLCDNHPYINNKSIGTVYKKDIYINPASTVGRTLIKQGIKEIINNYEVDGIQFDDYFYPTKNKSFDKQQYSQYVNSVGKNNSISLEEWRFTNVNILIAETYNLIKKTNSDIKFGISPQGNLENNKDLYADVKSWCCQSGYIDYICPQLYFSLENPALTFQNALTQWQNIDFCNDVKLYIGICGYKIGTDSDENTWKKSNNILKQELNIIRKNDIKGFMFYSFADLQRKETTKEIDNLSRMLD